MKTLEWIVYTLLFLGILACFFFPQVLAAGQVEGEQVLDSSANYASNHYSSSIENGLGMVPGAVQGVQATSSLTNSLSTQFQNKEEGQNQNVDLDVAKKNLEHSKDSVTQMFFFIVSTFIVLFDMIVSIIYIAMMTFALWLLFTGYSRLMIMLINFIYGKYQKHKGGA